MAAGGEEGEDGRKEECEGTEASIIFYKVLIIRRLLVFIDI